ncbi:MAG: GNAT family N-acetyltransferase [Acidobacteria bacterium]|nr:GNAT family N-acetyltransferase [Acidobacteriota bacterium]
MTSTVRLAEAADAAALAALAAATFPLACPPHTTAEAIAEFIATTLSESAFADYLANPDRALYLAEVDGDAAGYTMLIFGEPSDRDAAAAITVHPTAELSKVYVRAEHHGAGVAALLMAVSIEAARDRAAAGIWLGVNQENARANRFYEKTGFRVVGTKKFLVGSRWEDDFVRELVFSAGVAG